MKHYLFILFLMFTMSVLQAQDTMFIKSYGQVGYNYGVKILQAKDSGYIILGNRSSAIGMDVYLLKTTPLGYCQWEKLFNGSEVNYSQDIIATSDKGYVITGYMTIPEHGNDYDFMLIKTDSLGTLQWMKHYGGPKWDLAHSVVETPDGGFIIAGETYSFGHGNNDVMLLKTNSAGDSLWTKVYGGSNEDIAYDIKSCYDGNYIVTGITNSFGKGGYDAYLLKIKSSGDTLWTRTYGDTLDDKAFTGIETKDHGFALTGSTRNFNAQALDGIIFKTDSLGNQQWYRLIGGPGDEEFYDIIQNNHDKLFIVGYTTSYGQGGVDFYMVVTDDYGWFIYGTTFGGEKTDIAYSGIATFDNGFAALGTTESMGLGLSNILFVKMDSTCSSNATSYLHLTDLHEYSLNGISVYPNPVKDILKVSSPDNCFISELKVINIQGEVLYQNTPLGKHAASIDFSGFPVGLYMLVVIFINSIAHYKILHVH